MHQQTQRKLKYWVMTVCAVVAFGCGDAATGPTIDPDPDPNPDPQLGDVSVESSIGVVIAVGVTTQLSATVTNTDGSTVSGANLSWQTSDSEIATVNGSGLVTGVGAGQATITATYNGVGGNVPITVIDADLDAIARLGNDPLLSLLVERLESDLSSQLTNALDELNGAVTVGNCLAVRDALQAALAGTSESTEPDDVVSLAVLGLALERAQDLLGL